MRILAVDPGEKRLGLAISDPTGTIAGTVLDPSGAAVSAAVITLTNTNTGEVRKVTTDELGNYRFPFIPPGTYSVHAERTGFQTMTVEALVLTVDADLRQDLTLKIGSVSETVMLMPTLEMGYAPSRSKLPPAQRCSPPLAGC